MNGGQIQGYLSDKNGNPVRGALVTTYLPQGGKATASSDETGGIPFILSSNRQL